MIVKYILLIMFVVFKISYFLLPSQDQYSHIMNKYGLKIMQHLGKFFDQGF